MRNKFEKIVSDLKWKIKSGVYAPLDKLPSENALAKKYECSRLTGRKALQSLKEQKYLISRKGRGYFVSLNREKMIYTPRSGDKELMHSFHQTTLAISDSITNVFVDIFPDALKYENSFNYSFFKKSLDHNKKPFTVLRSFLNTDIFKNIKTEEVQNSIAAFFAKNNTRIIKRKERVMIEKAPKEISIKLHLSKDQMVVVAYSVMFNEKDIPVEFAIRYTKLEDFKIDINKKYK